MRQRNTLATYCGTCANLAAAHDALQLPDSIPLTEEGSMRRAAPAGVLLCGIVSVFLTSCSDDTPTSASAAQPAFAATSSSTCDPKTRPGKLVEKVVTAAPAWGVAVRDDGLTYFAQPFIDQVGITSTSSRTILGSIPSSSWPLGLAFSPDGGTAYVTHLFSNDVGVIDVASATEVGTIPTVGSPFVVRVSPDGERLFVATDANVVMIVSTATRELIKTVEVGFAPNAFAVHPDGRMMYVSAFAGGTVSEIDMITETVMRTFVVGGTPQDMAVNKKGDRLYVANEIGVLNEVNLLNGASAPDIPLKGGGFGLGVTPDDGEAYVAEPGNGLVEVFGLQTRKLTRTITVGGEPRRVAFSQQGKIGAISNMAGYITFVR
jgi:YVTN family beta-propeller protein